MPVFTFEAMLNIALPLFIVTMAGQNLPGLTVLAAYDYRPRVAPLLLSTGAASALGAPFGMPTINLAAITAALVRRARRASRSGAPLRRRHLRRHRLHAARRARRRRGGAGGALAAGADRGGRRPCVDRRVRRRDAECRAGGGRPAARARSPSWPPHRAFRCSASARRSGALCSAWSLINCSVRAGRKDRAEACAAAVGPGRAYRSLPALPAGQNVRGLPQRRQEVRGMRARLFVRRCGRRSGDLRDPALRLHRGRRRADRRGRCTSRRSGCTRCCGGR